MGENLADSWNCSTAILSTSTDIKSLRALLIMFGALSCSFTPTIWKLGRVYRHSATLIDDILTNKSDVDITKSDILSDICNFFPSSVFDILSFKNPALETNCASIFLVFL